MAAPVGAGDGRSAHDTEGIAKSRDPEALEDNPDIIRAGLPVFFFDEVERLRGKTPEELKAIGMVKTVFPTGRVLQ